MAALLCCGDVIRRPQLSLYHCVPFLVEMNKEWKVLAVFFFLSLLRVKAWRCESN